LAARFGKPTFFHVARAGPLGQMFPSGSARTHRGMSWRTQTSI